jgi:hypothetical protein
MSTANIIRLVQTVLAASVAAFAISVVVAGPVHEDANGDVRMMALSVGCGAAGHLAGGVGAEQGVVVVAP